MQHCGEHADVHVRLPQGGREKRKNPLFASRESRASEPAKESTTAAAFRSLFRRRDRTETS